MARCKCRRGRVGKTTSIMSEELRPATYIRYVQGLEGGKRRTNFISQETHPSRSVNHVCLSPHLKHIYLTHIDKTTCVTDTVAAQALFKQRDLLSTAALRLKQRERAVCTARLFDHNRHRFPTKEIAVSQIISHRTLGLNACGHLMSMWTRQSSRMLSENRPARGRRRTDGENECATVCCGLTVQRAQYRAATGGFWTERQGSHAFFKIIPHTFSILNKKKSNTISSIHFLKFLIKKLNFAHYITLSK